MKQVHERISLRHLFALLLALAVCFGGVSPALAAENEVHERMPVITLQPVSVTVRLGETFQLRMEAAASSGEEVVFRWYREDGAVIRNAIDGAGNATLTMQADEECFATYYCVAYNAVDDSFQVASEHVVVSQRNSTLLELIEDLRAELDAMPSLREGLERDSLYLINGGMQWGFMNWTILCCRMLSWLNLPEERIETALDASLWLSTPLLVAVFVPYCLVALLVSVVLFT